MSSSTLGLSVLFRSAQKKYRTSVVTGSDVFSWTTDNTFVMPGEDAITVGVWYEGEELGVVPISPEQWNGEGEPRVLTLQGRRMDTKEIGEVHLALHKQDAAILPDKNYYDLLKTLVTHLSLIDKLVAVSNKKEKPIAECLVKAFEMGRSAVHYIKHVTKTEIDETPNPSIIFRGNTVATKSVDMYMRLVGTPYLHLVMKPILLNIINNGKDKKKSCEVDPTRLEDRDDKRSKICSRNCGNLLGYVTQIFEAIKSTFKSYPTNFRIIFEHIKTTVRNRFSEDADGQVASLRAVAGFVFLRFFCVSLLSPKNFGLITEHPPPNVARDLTLIAKVLQNLANLVEFGKKEPYMILCNKYINDNIGEMKGLLDKMSSLDEEVSNELPVKNQINWGREMARVHFHFEDNLELMKEKYPSESNEDIQILSSVLTKLDQEIENDLKLTAPTKRSKDGNNKWLESTVSQSDENNKARVKLGTKATTTSNLPTMRVRKKAFLMSSKTNVNITPTEVEEESTSWNMVKPKKPKEFED
uniref:Ras-GAP domain-containing protein n=1 Tax=Arcella intermedia TaxID=1963864 RepID=A0A6B2L1B6_9EUKA